MHRRRLILLSALLLGSVIVSREPFRNSAFALLRFPFTAIKALASVLVLLPDIPQLTQERQDLRATLIQRQLEIARLRESLRSAEREAAINLAFPSAKGLSAAVIGRSMIPTQHTVLLNRGSGHGLNLNAVVVDASGVVGRVVELSQSSALVMLLTDGESRIAAMVERSRETGLLVGLSRGVCTLTYMDSEADVRDGDRIVTAGLGGPFPKGLLLGKVRAVDRDESTGAVRAEIVPAAYLGRLEEVLVLPPEKIADR